MIDCCPLNADPFLYTLEDEERFFSDSFLPRRNPRATFVNFFRETNHSKTFFQHIFMIFFLCCATFAHFGDPFFQHFGSCFIVDGLVETFGHRLALSLFGQTLHKFAILFQCFDKLGTLQQGAQTGKVTVVSFKLIKNSIFIES